MGIRSLVVKCWGQAKYKCVLDFKQHEMVTTER